MMKLKNNGAAHYKKSDSLALGNGGENTRIERPDMDKTDKMRVYARLAQMPIKETWEEYVRLEKGTPYATLVRNYLAEQNMNLVMIQAIKIKSVSPMKLVWMI